VLDIVRFVLSHLPSPPASVLEVGCGDGELARAVDGAGYDVMAIDPMAPEGEIFRRIKLEELEDEARFDAVVASRVFHHMTDLDASLERVARALEGGGPVVVEEFGWDLLDVPTAEWYEGQRRVLSAALDHDHAPSVDDWEEHHAHLHHVHRFDTLRAALDAQFEERHFERVPYLWRYLGGPATLPLEETLISAGLIQAIGFRFVGIPRSGAALG
jgi:2-polyprenyl-3-methyl-5-hydroxy-6-metoxy-1,4-benzoquinol methylase